MRNQNRCWIAIPRLEVPFFTQTAFYCYDALVLSTNTCSGSNSFDDTVKNRLKTTERTQRRNRLNTLC